MYMLNPNWDRAEALVKEYGRFWTKIAEKHNRVGLSANEADRMILAYPGDIIEVGCAELMQALADSGYTDISMGPRGVEGYAGPVKLEVWVNGSKLFWVLTFDLGQIWEGEGDFPPAGQP